MRKVTTGSSKSSLVLNTLMATSCAFSMRYSLSSAASFWRRSYEAIELSRPRENKASTHLKLVCSLQCHLILDLDLLHIPRLLLVELRALRLKVVLGLGQGPHGIRVKLRHGD